MAVIWQDKNEDIYCLIYNFDSSLQEVIINGMNINVKPKEFLIKRI
jgi:hypothetical protein